MLAAGVRTHAHLAKENVEALMARPSTGGTRNPEVTPVEAVDMTSAAWKAKVTTAIEAYSIAASSAAAPGATVGRAAARSAPRASRAPPRRPRPARARRPTRRRARSRCPCGAARARSPSGAPRRGAASVSARPRQAARGPRRRPAASDDGHLGVEQASRRGRRHQLRHGRPRGELPRAAGVDTAEQRLDQPVDDLVPEPARDQVADRHVLVERHPGCSSVTRASPSSDSTPDAAQLVEVERHAHQRARQRAERAAGPDASSA